ncbi:MAG: ABC-2 family transporter protein [Armatimonadota bacterium]|nr:ABC-2 family transporter protein [Armatimonadota bacterium]MDR5697318.1 ABC-2 family transporter protein [Armatimonadota bacterium]
MRLIRIAWTYLRVGLAAELQYRANFAVQALQTLGGLGFALGGVWTVFGHTQTLAGWHPEEVAALVGVYFLIRGAINAVIQPSMQLLLEDVRRGTLDFTLTKPEDAQLLVSVRRVEVWRIVDVLVGVAVLAAAVGRLGGRIGVADALAFGVALACGAAIVYSFLLALATFTFWFVRVENILVIFQSMYTAGQWPVGIYPAWLRASLTFVVPIAFAVTVPAEGLTGRLDPVTLGGAAALAVGLLALSRAFWKVGLRRYTGASA